MVKTKPRKWLIRARERMRLDRQQFGVKCGCSDKLIYMLEETGTITHPQIAAQIVRFIGGDVENYNDLVDDSRRARVVPKIVEIKERCWYSKLL
jgi:hypothetical protein